MNLSPWPVSKFFDNDGEPMAAGLLYVYAAGSTTKLATWQDSAGSSLNSNPIVLNFRGECRVWLDPTLAYKFVLSPPTDTDPPTNPIWTVDNITAGPSSADNAAEDTGSANTVQLSIPRLSGTPAMFDRIVWKSNFQNTASANVVINGGLSRTLVWQNRAVLSPGALQSDGMYEAIYDGTFWQLQGPTLDPTQMITVEEFLAGVTPSNYTFQPGDIRRYAVLDGVTDDTAAIRDWASLGGNLTWPVVATGLITGEITLVSNSTLTFAKGATIKTATQNISIFGADSKTNIVIRGAKFQQTSSGSNAFVAGVRFTSCTFCEVHDSEFVGLQWSGVYLDSSLDCKVIGNYFHDFVTTTGIDSAHITVYRDSTRNEVSGNRCFSVGDVDVGVFVQDPTGVAATTLPSYNKVIGNWCKGQRAYGITLYMGGPTHQGNNDVIGNTVESVTGTHVAGASGNGIYLVGAGLGSCRVIGNLVRACCTMTTSALNGPAGITVAGTAAAGSRIVVADNSVEEMSQGSGILLVDLPGGATVTGNTIRMPSINDGTGVGGASLLGQGIKVLFSDDVSIVGNNVYQAGTSDACFSFASGLNINRINITGNVFQALTGNALRLDRTAAFIHSRAVISANQLRCGSTSNMLAINGADQVSVTGNCGNSDTAPAFSISACLLGIFANNSGTTNGAVGVITGGVCTGSYYDKTNNINGTITNAATGLKTEFFAAVVPATGTAAVGDRAEMSIPVVGSPKGWRCTVAGTPGTWVSEGAL